MAKEQKPGTQPPAESEGKPPEYLSERALSTLRKRHGRKKPETPGE